MSTRFKPLTGLQTEALEKLKAAGGQTKFIAYSSLAAEDRMLSIYTLQSLEKRGLVTHIDSEGRSYWKVKTE